MFRRIQKIAEDTAHTVRIENHFQNFLKYQEEGVELKYQLPKELEENYINYYRSFGFKHVATDWIRFYYGLTGKYDCRLIPDDIFALYIDPIYPEIRDHWQNKAYQPVLVPEATFPHTIVKKTSGYYLNEENQIISEKKALSLIKKYPNVVIKPSVFTGAGVNVNFYESAEVNKKVLDFYRDEFLVQEPLLQSEYMSRFNSSSLSTVKITTYLYRGKVYILSSFLRIAAPGAKTDNLCKDKRNYAVGINMDGTLHEFGQDGNYQRVTQTCNGITFAGEKLDFYPQCIELIRKVHTRLLKFPLISWDFAQAQNGSPVLIEYNFKWHSAIFYQLISGPLFGELTDDVLRDVVWRAKDNWSLRYR